ncbi:MAG TPA: VanW family protein [Bacillota bacterium]|nr:VanW family protein [Bacillota bacterium]
MNKRLTAGFSFLIMLLVALCPSPGFGTVLAREHPLGHAAKGLLVWENDEEFQKRCMEHHTLIRMAAFQTTLPDPLPGEEYNVGLAARMLAGTLVQPGQVFSLNKELGPRTKGRGFQEGPAYSGGQIIRVIGGGICKISTTLYNVAVLANLDIVERKAHGMLVPYVPPGQDATVSFGSLDFKFRNTSGSTILIWSEKLGNTLFIAFYGRKMPPQVKWRHEVLFRQKPPVIYHYNPKLRSRQKRVIQSGAESIRIKNWLEIYYQDGRTERKELGTDYYRPMPEIIEVGNQPHE